MNKPEDGTWIIHATHPTLPNETSRWHNEVLKDVQVEWFKRRGYKVRVLPASGAALRRTGT